MLRNMKIKNKMKLLLISLIAIALLLGTIGTVGMLSISNSQTKMHRMTQNAHDTWMIVDAIHGIRLEVRKVMMYFDSPDQLGECLDKITKYERQVEEKVASLRETLFTDSGHKMLEEIFQSYQAVCAEHQVFFKFVEERDYGAAEAWVNDHADRYILLQESCDQLGDLSFQMLESTSDNDRQLSMALVLLEGVGSAVAITIASVLGVYITRLIVRPLRQMLHAAEEIAVGNDDVTLAVGSTDEVGMLAQSLQKVVESERRQAAILEKLSQGNYTVSVEKRSEGDLMNQSIKQMVGNTNQILHQVREASNEVFSAAEQISMAAQTLSGGSSEQAASVEEFSSSMQEILHQARSNAESAENALQLTRRTNQLLETSDGSMQEMLRAMQKISDSSQAVAKVIKVIEDIAFQTNILALNAAVEAARAGQAGKGFAVVADEVRALAVKSNTAAQETAALIQDSLQHVGGGNNIVQRTSADLVSAAQCAQESLASMNDIVEASAKQQVSVQEVNAGMTQISHIVQQNSATAEETATASEEMAVRAKMLQDLVGQFRLAGPEERPALPIPAVPQPLPDPQKYAPHTAAFAMSNS